MRPRKVTKAFVLCAARAGLDHSNYLLFYFGATFAVFLVLVVLTGDLNLVYLLFYGNNYESLDGRSVWSVSYTCRIRKPYQLYKKNINYTFDSFLISKISPLWPCGMGNGHIVHHDKVVWPQYDIGRQMWVICSHAFFVNTWKYLCNFNKDNVYASILAFNRNSIQGS